MRKTEFIFCIFFLLLLPGSCITSFIPETNGDKNLLVVEGLITDQNETYSVKLSTSMPLGGKSNATPFTGASVTVLDDSGNEYPFQEKSAGLYVSDSTVFRGVPGRKYSLLVKSLNPQGVIATYKSIPTEMIPVPPIDSIYYEKIRLEGSNLFNDGVDDCQILVDAHDDTGKCKYFKWNYSETWEFHLHWNAPDEFNRACWISDRSNDIIIKNTSVLSEDKIRGYGINYIPHTTDKLEVKYSILVNQFSVSSDEFSYWDKLKTATDEVGTLYDQIPSFIQGNIYRAENPSEQVLGYFSVSAKASKRRFIQDDFAGQINLYKGCPVATIFNPPSVIEGVGSYLWILESQPFINPPYVVLTNDRGCVDCTTRGTITKPDFWDN